MIQHAACSSIRVFHSGDWLVELILKQKISNGAFFNIQNSYFSVIETMH